MTPFTNREGAVDYYDETVVEAVRAEAERYVRMNHKMPDYVGVSDSQFRELRKADQAGNIISVLCKGKRCVVTLRVATDNIRRPQIKMFMEERENRHARSATSN